MRSQICMTAPIGNKPSYTYGWNLLAPDAFFGKGLPFPPLGVEVTCTDSTIANGSTTPRVWTSIREALEHSVGSVLCRIRVKSPYVKSPKFIYGNNIVLMWKKDIANALDQFSRDTITRYFDLWRPDVFICKYFSKPNAEAFTMAKSRVRVKSVECGKLWNNYSRAFGYKPPVKEDTDTAYAQYVQAKIASKAIDLAGEYFSPFPMWQIADKVLKASLELDKDLVEHASVIKEDVVRQRVEMSDHNHLYYYTNDCVFMSE